MMSLFVTICLLLFAGCSADAPGSQSYFGSLENNLEKFVFQSGNDAIFSECFEVPNSFCIGGTSQVITARSVPKGLAGWWTFDDIYPVDQSGNSNHMHPAIPTGPAMFGHGGSGSFLNGVKGVVKHNEVLNSEAFTVAFWVYIIQDSTGAFRSIFSKGSESQLTPSILLYPNSRRLSIRISSNLQASEGMPSVGTIPLRRWTHVAVTCSGTSLKLYLNGVKDTETTLRGSTMKNYGDIIVHSFGGYLDELRFYTHELPENEVASFSFGGQTGISDPSFITLGCARCPFEEAFQKTVCPETHHLCSLGELYTGGFHNARINGWLEITPSIWYRDISEQDIGDESKMAICCKSNNEHRNPELRELGDKGSIETP